jgi:predicted nucleic acid-binding protein
MLIRERFRLHAEGVGEVTWGMFPFAQDDTALEHEFLISEVADYELRRELIRIRATRSLARLDELSRELRYVPVTTATWRSAANLWAWLRCYGVEHSGAATVQLRLPWFASATRARLMPRCRRATLAHRVGTRRKLHHGCERRAADAPPGAAR